MEFEVDFFLFRPKVFEVGGKRLALVADLTELLHQFVIFSLSLRKFLLKLELFLVHSELLLLVELSHLAPQLGLRVPQNPQLVLLLVDALVLHPCLLVQSLDLKKEFLFDLLVLFFQISRVFLVVFQQLVEFTVATLQSSLEVFDLGGLLLDSGTLTLVSLRDLLALESELLSIEFHLLDFVLQSGRLHAQLLLLIQHFLELSLIVFVQLFLLFHQIVNLVLHLRHSTALR